MKSTGRKKYFENLDGLRAIAALAVIFSHAARWFDYPETKFYEQLKFIFRFGGDGGGLGVTFFFILSGFLITFLMFQEQEEHGSIHIVYFYMRRVLRIWPLYYMTIIVGFAWDPLTSWLSGEVHVEKASILLYALFAANFDHIYHGMPETGILGVQWSVAVEEQFYLLWPFIFHVFSKKKMFPLILLCIIVMSEMFNAGATHRAVSHYHLVSNFRFLALGGLLAFVCHFKNDWLSSCLDKLSRRSHWLIYGMGLSLMLFNQKLAALVHDYKYAYHFIPPLFFSFVIVEQNFSNHSFFKIGSCEILNWLGKISYGLYLTHMLAIYLILVLFPQNPEMVLLKVAATLALTVVISHGSHAYVESFFMSLKNRFSRMHGDKTSAFKK